MDLIDLAVLVTVALASYLAQDLWLKKAERAGLLSRDLHKPGEVKSVRVGTVPHVMAMITLISWSIWELDVDPFLISSIYYAVLGLVDDLLGLRNLEKIAYSSIPFVAAYYKLTAFPPFSSIPVIYMLAPILYGVYVTNAFNTLAGFNGIEMGSVAIISGFLSILSWLRGSYGALFIFLSSTILALVFLRVNWYPARAFPGNLGTFFFGGVIALTSALYGLYWETILLMIPHGVDFFMKLISWGRTAKKLPSKVSEDGTLRPPGNLSLAALLIRKGINREEKLVSSVLFMELLIGACLLFFHFLIHFPG